MRVHLAAMAALILLSSCNKPVAIQDGTREPIVTPAAGIYPHSEEFKKSRAHGQAFQQDGMTCAKCHGNDLRGGTANTSCTQCHTSFPHVPSWGAPTEHGVAYLKLSADEKKSCATCHGTQDDKGYAVSCQSCHAAYPHSRKFMKGGHAELARSLQGKCAVCHEAVKEHLPNVGKRIDCGSCHVEGFPHARNWADPKNHGQAYVKLDASDREECLSCHEAKNPSSEISCQSCHSVFPHNEEFMDGHGDFAETYEGKCAACHTGFARNMPNMAEGCKTCHRGDLRIGWKRPAPPEGSAPHALVPAPADRAAVEAALKAAKETRKPAHQKKKSQRPPGAKKSGK